MVVVAEFKKVDVTGLAAEGDGSISGISRVESSRGAGVAIRETAGSRTDVVGGSRLRMGIRELLGY